MVSFCIGFCLARSIIPTACHSTIFPLRATSVIAPANSFLSTRSLTAFSAAASLVGEMPCDSGEACGNSPARTTHETASISEQKTSLRVRLFQVRPFIGTHSCLRGSVRGSDRTA